MDFCYQELSQLAAERRARLEESRRLWKFFWEMAEEVVLVPFYDDEEPTVKSI